MILYLLLIAALYESNTMTYSEISLYHNVFIISFGYKEHKSKKDKPIYKIPLPPFLFLECPNIIPPLIDLFMLYLLLTGSSFVGTESIEDLESRELGSWFRFP
jgi:hypothetical protein